MARNVKGQIVNLYFLFFFNVIYSQNSKGTRKSRTADSYNTIYVEIITDNCGSYIIY